MESPPLSTPCLVDRRTAPALAVHWPSPLPLVRWWVSARLSAAVLGRHAYCPCLSPGGRSRRVPRRLLAGHPRYTYRTRPRPQGRGRARSRDRRWCWASPSHSRLRPCLSLPPILGCRYPIEWQPVFPPHPPSQTFGTVKGCPTEPFARSDDLAHLVRVWPLRGDAERVVFLNSRGFNTEHHFLVQTGFWCKADIS